MQVIEQRVGEPSTKEVLGSAATNPSTPRTTGYPLPSLGSTWTVASLENRIIAQYEEYVEAQTLQKIYKIAQKNPQEADAQRAVYQKQSAAGAYKWDFFECGEVVQASRMSVSGMLYLFYLLLRRCHPQLTEIDAKKIALDNMQGTLDAIRWAQGNWEAQEKEALGIKLKDASDTTTGDDGLPMPTLQPTISAVTITQ